MGAAPEARALGTKPRSSAPTFPAASCSRLYPFHPSVTIPAASTRSWTSFITAALSARPSMPAPTMTMGFAACFRVSRNLTSLLLPLPLSILVRAALPAPRCAHSYVRSGVPPMMEATGT